MSLIVVTGLDGSGKSTFLNKIEAKTVNDKTAILRTPKIDAELFKTNQELYRQSIFINYVGIRADKEKLPSLKIIAMFGAMILFNELYKELKKQNTTIYSERHPLIDTIVYAKVYYKFMAPDLLDKQIAKSIEKEFEGELKNIIDCLPVKISPTGKGLCFDLLYFLHNWFSEEKNYSFEQMKVLFPIEIPKYVYFLEAPIPLLIKRLGKRDQREYHEKENLLEKMHPIYLNLLANNEISYQLIDTSSTLISDKVLSNMITYRSD